MTAQTQLIDASILDALQPRPHGAHKGQFGHVLVIGGDHGMAGAVRLAAEAAARVGSGLVSVATHKEHAVAISAVRPELMCHAVDSADQLRSLLDKVNVVVIGPGLGQDLWSRQLLMEVLQVSLPLVVDADALNLIAYDPVARGNWIITPHPGEAARLLGLSDTSSIQSDRFSAVYRLSERYKAVSVLKGASTLVAKLGQQTALCEQGNPGMASGGMGDVLSGVIGGLVAQGLDLFTAAQAGVYLHAMAGDRAAEKGGERGLLASDVIVELRGVVNKFIS